MRPQNEGGIMVLLLRTIAERMGFETDTKYSLIGGFAEASTHKYTQVFYGKWEIQS